MSHYHSSKKIEDESRRLSLLSEIANKDAKRPLREIQKKHNVKRIVDVGCGTGEAFPLLKEVFKDCFLVGLDQSKEALAVAKTRGLADSLVQVDILNLEKINELPFDLVFIRNTLLHISNPKIVLDKIKPLLTPKGIVFIQEPDWSTAKGNWQDFSEFKEFVIQRMRSFGINPFFGKEVSELLKKSNFHNAETQVSTSKIKAGDKLWEILDYILEVTGGDEAISRKLFKAGEESENYFITPAWVITWATS